MSAPTARVDPVTLEVVRHRLWQINDEQAAAIKAMSASPIVVEGNDFNTGLYTRDLQLATAGSGSLVHVTTMGTALRNFVAKIGDIEDGDVVLTNDPFLGALHQSDVIMMTPLVHDGEPIMWIGNVLHHADVGGIDEGSFCTHATSIYQEPPRYLMRVVRQGVPAVDAQHTFVTNSRLPEMAELDLQAQIGALNVAKARLAELVRRRGADVVDAVTATCIERSRRRLRERILELPDGVFHGQAWMDGDRIGSDRLVRVQVALRKDDDRLLFDYTGSDPQVDSAVNSTFHATVSGSAVPVFTYLCGGDIEWNEGVTESLRVIAPEGTVVNAVFPAPVSICTVGFRWLVTVAASQALAAMLDASPRYRGRVCPSWSSSANCLSVFGEVDGRRVGSLMSDHRAGGGGARSFKDGVSHAGQASSFTSSVGNVETAESKLPVLYMHRRALPDSGGPGTWRGGQTAGSAFVPYGTDAVLYKSTNTAGTDQSNAHGIAGGLPGAGSQVVVVRGSDAWAGLREGRPPIEIADFGGQAAYLPSKSDGMLGPDDAVVFYPCGGGGYGDPLDRDPELVARDVREGAVTASAAREVYCVELAPEGGVDAAGTQRLRTAERAERARTAMDQGEGPAGACHSCGSTRSLLRRLPLGAAGPWISVGTGGHSERFELRQWLCGECLAATDVREERRGVAMAETAAEERPS